MSGAEIAVRTIIGIVGGLGLIMNTIVLTILSKKKLTSRVTTALMRSQCIVDGYVSMMALLYQIIGPVIITPWVELNRILCYAWFMDQLFWLGALLSVQNLVCISFDRLMAVNWPIFYRLHQLGLIIGCYIYIAIICLFMFIPTFLLRHFDNTNTCSFAVPVKASALHQFLDIHAILWSLLAYCLPATFIITCHVVVIRFVRQAKNSEHGDEQQRKSQKSLYKLIKITATLAASILTFHALETMRYLLASFHIVDYEPGTPEQQVDVLVIAFCCFLNPCLSLNTKVSLRRLVNKYILHKMSKWKLSTAQWTQSDSKVTRS
ncbi:hypothetical protein FGIG_09531 [Fasciola gigantica]|uniref:G-protein coupled receptors family 1 profile domain-containing protein n=1 Tax=Fasciola gigantica TaxID=46835 RepID=A0A504Z6E4_FASGI|nr:hypothetical protein FGIG_09531 [Fasciola gigantica]